MIQLDNDMTSADNTGIHRQKGRRWGKRLMRGKKVNLANLDLTVRQKQW